MQNSCILRENALAFRRPTLAMASRNHNNAEAALTSAASATMTTSAATGSEGSAGSNSASGTGGARRQTMNSATRFKGVVLQQNGNWGAQIYTNHSRIWLGTFKTERAAAMAYDSAAIKLHCGGSHRNFPWSETTAREPVFQENFSTEAVLAMIRDGTYESRFAEFFSRHAATDEPRPPAADQTAAAAGLRCVELFQKELTPSDVGKLNRLVVPKKNAVQYFPAVPETSPEGEEEILLEFRDRDGRAWLFRYCYWRSSQSYVFTKGWNKFVKDKGLKAKDVVTFYHCEDKEDPRRAYCMIDVAYYERPAEAATDYAKKIEPCSDAAILRLRREKEGEGEVMSEMEADPPPPPPPPPPDVREMDEGSTREGMAVMLFGVNIA